MAQLNQEEINSLRKICKDIGCSGLDPDMCKNRPHHCDIIKKFIDYCRGNQSGLTLTSTGKQVARIPILPAHTMNANTSTDIK